MAGDVVAHLCRALDAHVLWCRVNGIEAPGVLGALALALASGGPGRTVLDPGDDVGDGGVMLTLSYDEVAARLSVSGRTVQRLVSRGELPVVDVGGTRRVRVEDLRAYVSGLAEICRVVRPDDEEICR